METGLREMLPEFEQRLRTQGAPVLDLLAPGLDADEVTATLEASFGTAPAELVEWFSWHNGLAASPPTPFNPYERVLIGRWRQYSLSEAVHYVKEGVQWAGGPTDGSAWLPLVAGLQGQGQGQGMLIASWHRPEQVAVVRSAWGDFPTGPPLAHSVAGLVAAWLSVLEGLRWDPNTKTWEAQKGASQEYWWSM